MITVSPRLIAYGVVSALLIGSHAAMYAGGRSAGATASDARWMAVRAEEQAQREALQTRWRAQLDAWEAERRRLEQEAADAIAEIRVEYLPGKTEIRRQIVERAVYRDCRIDDGMRDILNAALRGRPIAPEPQPVAAGGGLVPGGTAGHG